MVNGLSFRADWPQNPIVPFAAKRQTSVFEQNVSLGSQSLVNGTFLNLYARIDKVAVYGSPGHDAYCKAVKEIVGVFIGTRSASGGKEAGYYFDQDNFVTLDRMGDGVSEMVALIVELSLAKNKIFILEEPETNLHPKGLKALLALIRKSSETNQFIIATHSNIVVRELAGDETKIFRVSRDGDSPNSPSKVSIVENSSVAHRDLLRELGYEFADFGLHDAWLILEESSAETIITEILIPWFVPGLKGRLRTFSASGVTNLEPRIAEFQRLVTFIHLQPVYRDRMWVWADGDEAGKQIIDRVRGAFPYLTSPRAGTFEYPKFEMYYPSLFADDVETTLATVGKQPRRVAKASLLAKVKTWSLENKEDAHSAWAESAAEQITLLKKIQTALN